MLAALFLFCFPSKVRECFVCLCACVKDSTISRPIITNPQTVTVLLTLLPPTPLSPLSPQAAQLTENVFF